jgi:hypothetical protein
MKARKRLAHEVIIAAAFLLGSCASDGKMHSLAETYDLADTANANARNALAKCDELQSRLSDVESRLNM